MPVTASVADTVIAGLAVLETALALPVKVSCAWRAPAAVRLADPQVLEMPPGSPVTLKLAALAAREALPTGVTVTVTTCVAVDFMLICAGESAIVIAGADVTCIVSEACAVTPSPVAVILNTVLATAAVVAAFRVSVEVVLPATVLVKDPPVQVAVIPAGSPVTPSVTSPE